MNTFGGNAMLVDADKICTVEICNDCTCSTRTWSLYDVYPVNGEARSLPDAIGSQPKVISQLAEIARLIQVSGIYQRCAEPPFRGYCSYHDCLP
jgi:hypothetical protein